MTVLMTDKTMKAANQTAKEASVWLNGQACSKIPVTDRALHYGDGFFTTALVFNRQILNWPLHQLRIDNSLQSLQIKNLSTTQINHWIKQALTEYFADASQQHASLKIIISRGAGAGYQMPQNTQPNCLIFLSDGPYPQNQPKLPVSQALIAGICQKTAAISDLAGVKHLNRLDNVMACSEVIEKDWQEGVMLNAFGHIVSGTQSNLFWLTDQVIYTPAIENSGVLGTSRAGLLELLRSLGYRIKLGNFGLQSLQQADEVWFSNALRGIMPVTAIDYGADKPLNTLATDLPESLQPLWHQWQSQQAVAIAELD